MLKWFVDKILPALGVAVILAVVNMYMQYVTLHDEIKHIDERVNTLEFNVRKAIDGGKVVMSSVKVDIAVLKEKCLAKEVYYKERPCN